MPSIQETRQYVQENIDKQTQDPDHDDILAGLQDEIDQHNAVKTDLRDTMRKCKRSHPDSSPDTSARPTRFRFKSRAERGDQNKNGKQVKSGQHRSRRSKENEQDRQHRKRREQDYSRPADEEEAAHPFPREPTDPLKFALDSQDAFRESLFDALADDEAALYWESVYSQPIHTYRRPTVETEKGEIEQMSDGEYVEYVKTKMWERKHPEIVLERQRSERKRREEEEKKSKEKEEFARRKEQAAWEKSQQRWFRGGNAEREGARYEYEFAHDVNSAPDRSEHAQQRKEYEQAWSRYLESWTKLKNDVLAQRTDTDQVSLIDPSKRMPWPVLASKPVIKSNIEDFMRRAPVSDILSREQVLKAERVRWHPDKVQQRFGGKVDEGTMKVVTGVFQVVDGLVEEERKKSGG